MTGPPPMGAALIWLNADGNAAVTPAGWAFIRRHELLEEAPDFDGLARATGWRADDLRVLRALAEIQLRAVIDSRLMGGPP